MSENTKNVLDSIKEAINKNDDSIDSFLIDIECWKELLDYITNLQNQLEEKTYLYNKLDIESKYVINNLQEENKELLLELSGYREAILKNDELLGLQERIDKAIEYIEKYIIGNKLENVDWEFDDCNYSDMPVERIKPLIDILKGEK